MTKYKMLELYKGTGSVGKVGKKYFNEIISLDFDEKSKATITTDILDWNYKDFHKETNFIPDFIWASPPCNTFSSLSYPLKERNPKTAEPYSDRAKNGTKILYMTIDIINFFLKLNPNLLFVIENPKGMMRKDKRIKRMNRETTLYCLYGDKRRKPTDFFSNFQLKLKQETKCKCKTVGVVELPLNERYKIPSKLINHILKRFIEMY
jgi:site-specific DNA-cytosine methylase